ncbi:MAG TPA: hypothetical protein VMB18_07280 [Terriglobales bacterium]|nr:hypothetical protein [Terriglobales bacterium]
MKIRMVSVLILLATMILSAQTTPPAPAADDYSGMYSFRKEGEFVQITVEDASRVTGFVSRYGDGESDQGVFLNQFFKDGKLDGKKLSFTTETVHGVWFDFKGTVDRGPGKTLADEGYYILKGTLTEHRAEADKSSPSSSSEVVLKSFPRDSSRN